MSKSILYINIRKNQSRIEDPEKLEMLDTQDRGRRQTKHHGRQQMSNRDKSQKKGVNSSDLEVLVVFIHSGF